jgi:predicted solute-binding protein
MLRGLESELFDLTFRLPSECADDLAAGRADIGIVPCAEFLRQDLEIAEGSGICCRGAVRSILLISRTPFGAIRTLAADSSSRTSVLLARIILEKRYGARPRVESMKPDLAAMLAAADAALIIGDPALRLDPDSLPYPVLDLGAEWMALTGLPMVFAVWAGPERSLVRESAAAFQSSCRYGLEHMDEIVAAEARPRGITDALAREYLTRHIVFETGEMERRGMELYLRYAAELTAACRPTR